MQLLIILLENVMITKIILLENVITKIILLENVMITKKESIVIRKSLILFEK